MWSWAIFCWIKARSSGVTGTRSTMFRVRFAIHSPSFLNRGWGFPQQATGHGPQEQRRAGFRKCGYTSYACYVSSSPLLKRSQHVQLPAKYGISLKKGQKNKRALRPSGKTENRGCFHTSPVSFADCSIFSAPSIAPSMTGK